MGVLESLSDLIFGEEVLDAPKKTVTNAAKTLATARKGKSNAGKPETVGSIFRKSTVSDAESTNDSDDSDDSDDDSNGTADTEEKGKETVSKG
jgi:hypothetical protein